MPPRSETSSATAPISGPPLLVIVGQLQEAVANLQRNVVDELAGISERLDAIDERTAATAAAQARAAAQPAYPSWVDRPDSGAGAAAAVTEAGDDQRAELVRIDDTLRKIAAAPSGIATADLAAAVSQLCADLATFTVEMRQGFMEVARARRIPHQHEPSPQVAAQLNEIRRALHLLLG
ncbi:MAG: hypothetical protein ACR2LQ_13535 [Acidimicrobiales bacterium]